MAKLGEAKLGSTQFAQPTPLDPDVAEVRERAEEVMKHSYPTEPGTIWDAFLNTILFELELMNDVAIDVFDDRFVDSATQAQLDMIGEFFALERREGERDEHFRARIKLQMPRHTTTTTNDFIRKVCAQLLNTDPRRFQMEESHTPRLPTDWYEMDEADQQAWLDDYANPPTEPARFDVKVEKIVMANAPLTADELEALIQDVKAAGVKAGVIIGEQFTHRNVEVEAADTENETHTPDDNDVQLAYGGVDPNTHERIEASDGNYGEYYGATYGETDTGYLGGVYADEITASQF